MMDGWNTLLQIRQIKIMSMADCCIGPTIDTWNQRSEFQINDDHQGTQRTPTNLKRNIVGINSKKRLLPLLNAIHWRDSLSAYDGIPIIRCAPYWSNYFCRNNKTVPADMRGGILGLVWHCPLMSMNISQCIWRNHHRRRGHTEWHVGHGRGIFVWCGLWREVRTNSIPLFLPFATRHMTDHDAAAAY